MKITNWLLSTVFFIGLVVLLTQSTTAQSNSDVSINVSAQVISSIEMITIESMQLDASEARNGIITINPQQSANAGKMVAIGTPNSEIRISYLQQRELTHQQGGETLLFEYNLVGNNQDDQASAKRLDSENRDFELNDEGRFYLWIGGNVDISTASPGNYQGEFTLDIEYI